MQIKRITARISILKQNPDAGKVVPEVNEKNVREFIEGNYRIIYEIVNPLQIDILTIHHSSRDLNKRKFL
jgi:toxin ParE1/3/4